jgi:hypothetical protein
VTADSIYSQLPSTSGGRLLHPQPEGATCRGEKRDPIDLYGCETWSLTLSEEHLSENRVLRRIFEQERDDRRLEKTT